MRSLLASSRWRASPWAQWAPRQAASYGRSERSVYAACGSHEKALADRADKLQPLYIEFIADLGAASQMHWADNERVYQQHGVATRPSSGLSLLYLG
jgi:hypothetical protein